MYIYINMCVYIYIHIHICIYMCISPALRPRIFPRCFLFAQSNVEARIDVRVAVYTHHATLRVSYARRIPSRLDRGSRGGPGLRTSILRRRGKKQPLDASRLQSFTEHPVKRSKETDSRGRTVAEG